MNITGFLIAGLIYTVAVFSAGYFLGGFDSKYKQPQKENTKER